MTRTPQEEPEVYSVVATEWGYPSQDVWVHESQGSWMSRRGGYLSWEELLELGEVTLLVPADQDRYEAGRREGRFEILRELGRAMHKLSEATYKIADPH